MPPAFVLSQDQTLKLTCRTGVTPFEAKSRSQAHAIIGFDSNDLNLDALASACCDCRTPPPAHPFRFHNVKQPSAESAALKFMPLGPAFFGSRRRRQSVRQDAPYKLRDLGCQTLLRVFLHAAPRRCGEAEPPFRRRFLPAARRHPEAGLVAGLELKDRPERAPEGGPR